MGLTGLVWAGFVLVHMLGNLLIFAGPDVYNHYSYVLVSNPFLILAELLLLITLLLHIYEGVMVTLRNRWARPTRYAQVPSGPKAPRFQSKWMIFHGSIILVFIITHLITFKYGATYEATVGGVQMRDLYRLVIEVFHNPAALAWYIIALIILGLHLSHGFYSSFASLGIYHPKFSPLLSKFGYVYAAAVAIGFIAPPVYVYFAL